MERIPERKGVFLEARARLRLLFKIWFTIAILCAVFSNESTCAQTPTLWADLKPGPYEVGFRISYKYDHSRTWKPKQDTQGRLQQGPRARPVRVSIWYPAMVKARSPKMSYKDYLYLQTNDRAFAELNHLLAERNLRSLRQILKGEQTLNSLLKTRMAAALNAAPLKKQFPLIIYSSGLNESWQHANFVLLEYLASHGYTIATVPQLGTTSLRLNLGINPIDIETQVRDLEFALGIMREFPGVDPNKLAAAGHSMGGIAALILQMRSQDIDVVVGLDASYASPGLIENLTKSAYYRPTRMKVPLMDLRRPIERIDMTALESFRYSDRYYLELPGIFHGDFTSFPMIALRFPTGIEGRTPETASRGYQVVCRYVLNFLNAYLKGDERSLKFLNNRPEENGVPSGVLKLVFRKGGKAPPTEEEFVRIILAEGLDTAIRIYRDFKAKEPQQPIINELLLIRLGYDFYDQLDYGKAVEVFKLAVAAHPLSANAYDSLAEAYMLSGDRPMAIKYYEKVLEVLPSDLTASEELKRSLKNTALEKLKELKR